MPKRHTHDVPKKLYVSDCRRKRRKGKGVLAATHPACYAAVHGFDVDDRRSVDGFDGTDPQAVLLDLADGDRMKAERIWAVGRASRRAPPPNLVWALRCAA